MKYPDWINRTVILRTVNRGGSTIVTEDGYVAVFAAACNGKAHLYINDQIIADCSSHDSWGDTDMNFLPVKKGDKFTFSGEGYSYESYVCFYPFK